MAFSHVKSQDIASIWGHIVGAAHAQQRTRNEFEMVRDTGISVLRGFHIPLDEPTQNLTPTQKAAKDAYSTVMAARNNFPFGGARDGAQMILIPVEDAEQWIRFYLYFDGKSGGEEHIRKAAAIFDQNSWTSKINEIRPKYDHVLPPATWKTQ